MEYIHYLSDLIERRKMVIRCHTDDELLGLADAVGVLYTASRKQDIVAYRGLPGNGKYVDGLCVRLEKHLEWGLDLGHSNSAYYQKMGYTIVDYSELLRCGHIDLGEIDVDTCDVCDLLFGG